MGSQSPLLSDVESAFAFSSEHVSPLRHKPSNCLRLWIQSRSRKLWPGRTYDKPIQFEPNLPLDLGDFLWIFYNKTPSVPKTLDLPALVMEGSGLKTDTCDPNHYPLFRNYCAINPSNLIRIMIREFRAIHPELIVQKDFGAMTEWPLSQIDSWKHATKTVRKQRATTELCNRQKIIPQECFCAIDCNNFAQTLRKSFLNLFSRAKCSLNGRYVMKIAYLVLAVMKNWKQL